MRNTSLIFLAVAAAAGISAAALPAHAMVRQIGAVNVSADHYTDVSWQHFEGPVVRLRMTAANDTVHCDHVDVTYRDGVTHEVFAGTMVKDSVTTVTFPEGDSRIKAIDFACKAESVDGARISLASLSEGMPGYWSRDPHVTTYESGEAISHDGE